MHYLLIREMNGFDHQEGVPVVSALVSMITH